MSIETVLPCRDLDANVAFFVDEVGCRVETISPADAPAEIVLSAGEARLRLVRADTDHGGHLRLARPGLPAGVVAAPIIAPNGTIIDVVAASLDVVVPPNQPSLSIVHADVDDAFGAGRAGMGYRDLLPGRWGGRFIASHIRIADGGEVADYVHFHRIRFQMIFVAAGWVEVVYEDQGPPFRMEAGDCVLQPPEIRHRVLRSSPGLEVIEIGCPAVHDTVVEHQLELPTAGDDPERDFGGQRFVRHVAAGAATHDGVEPGVVERDTGIAAATDGLAGASVLTVSGGTADSVELTHDGEFVIDIVLTGHAVLEVAGERSRLGTRDAVALPPAATWRWTDRSADFEWLEVSLPSGAVRRAR